MIENFSTNLYFYFSISRIVTESIQKSIQIFHQMYCHDGIWKRILKKELQKLHPSRRNVMTIGITYGSRAESNSLVFESINQSAISHSTMQTRWSGGPSRLDAANFWRMACSTKFKQVSGSFCRTLFEIVRKTVCKKVSWSDCTWNIHGMQNHRIRQRRPRRCQTIGVGEILRRVIGKTVSKLLKTDVCEANGVRQTCTWQEGGIESTILAATKVYGLASTDCKLQKDASNTFNTMIRELSLHNAQFVCPKINRYLVNTHRMQHACSLGKEWSLNRRKAVLKETQWAITRSV